MIHPPLSACPESLTMTTLLPTEIASREDLYESALDLLADGIALLKRDGAIVYVNAALRRLAAAGNEIRIERNAIEFASPDSRSRFAQAMSAGERGHDADAACLAADFAVPREDGQPPYTVSVRPLPRDGKQARLPDAAAMLLVHDPAQQSAAAARMLRELHGLTNAEALAGAGPEQRHDRGRLCAEPPAQHHHGVHPSAAHPRENGVEERRGTDPEIPRAQRLAARELAPEGGDELLQLLAHAREHFTIVAAFAPAGTAARSDTRGCRRDRAASG